MKNKFLLDTHRHERAYYEGNDFKAFYVGNFSEIFLKIKM